MRCSWAVLALCAAACGGRALPWASGDASVEGTAHDGADTEVQVVPSVPAVHREVATACANDVRPTGTCPQTAAAGDCRTDADCADGVNGRCSELGGFASCSCLYDACATDDDCPGHGLCVCSPGYTGNRCFGGNCRVDADCGPDGYCSPSADVTNVCGQTNGWFCHRPGDACVDNSDCGAIDRVCTFNTATGAWACAHYPACPT